MIGSLGIRRSARRRVPVFYLEGSKVFDREWYPYQLLSMARVLLEARKWKVIDEGLKLEHKKSGLILLPSCASFMIHEKSLWKRTYAPVSVEGKTVLDVGAGCGETAYFYFMKGARKVICVEPDAMAVECLMENAARHSWNVEVVSEPFGLEMLWRYDFDFMKIDGDGCEKELLSLNKLPTPAVIESHSTQLTDSLTMRFGAKIVAHVGLEISILQYVGD